MPPAKKPCIICGSTTEPKARGWLTCFECEQRYPMSYLEERARLHRQEARLKRMLAKLKPETPGA